MSAILSWVARTTSCEKMFSPFGVVASAQVIVDRDSGRSKGFGFVEMGTDQEAQAAIDGMHGQMIDGRALTVNEARPKEVAAAVAAVAAAVAAAAAEEGVAATAAVAVDDATESADLRVDGNKASKRRTP